MAVVREISGAVRRVRSDVCLIGLVESGDGFIRGLPVIIFRFVVKQRDLEMILIRGFLHECEVPVGKRTAIAIPVDNKSRDAHVTGLLNLPTKGCGIARWNNQRRCGRGRQTTACRPQEV